MSKFVPEYRQISDQVYSSIRQGNILGGFSGGGGDSGGSARDFGGGGGCCDDPER